MAAQASAQRSQDARVLCRAAQAMRNRAKKRRISGCYDSSCCRRSPAAAWTRVVVPPSCWPPASCAPRACRPAPRSSPPRLHPCASSEGPTDGYCGGLEVYEDRAAGTRPQDPPRDRGAAVGQQRRSRRPAGLPGRRPRAGRGADGVARAADVPQGAADARRRPRRSARHRQVEPAELPRAAATRCATSPNRTTRRSRTCGAASRGCPATRGSTRPTSRWTTSTTSARISATTA